MTMVWMLLLMVFVIGDGVCSYRHGDNAGLVNPSEEEIVPKKCFETLVTSKIVISYITKICYRRVKTTTGALFWKRTRYYQQSYPCRRSIYKTEYDIDYKSICCHGYIEMAENCIKEKTTSPNATCTCYSNETLVVNVTSNTCHCEGKKNESCSEIEIEKLTEGAANCSNGCELKRLPGNCSAICTCGDEVNERANFTDVTEVRSQMSVDSHDDSPSGLVAGILILIVVLVIIAIVAVVIVIKKKISRRKNWKAVMNLSYNFIEPNGGNLIRNATTTTSDNYDLAYSDIDISQACASGATNCKSLAVDNLGKENTYVTYNMGKGQANHEREQFLYDFPNTDNTRIDDTGKKSTETPYDLPKTLIQREGSSETPYDFPETTKQLSFTMKGGKGETPYDFPNSSDQQGKTSLHSNGNDMKKLQDEPQENSTYDIPKSSSSQRSDNAYSVVVKSSGQRPVAGEISDREYITMSVSSKGEMEMHQDNDMYVLPSEIGGKKLTHTYSNVAVGPYENVM